MVKINLRKKPDFDFKKPPKFNARKPVKLLKRKYWEIPNVEEPQEGLEPIIGDIYGSPPIDPRDCSLYPDSPWCGGNPISRKPIAYDFSLVIDECNIGVQLDAVLGFIKMPPVQIVYRNKSCINYPPSPEPRYEQVERFTPPYLLLSQCGSQVYLSYKVFSEAYSEGAYLNQGFFVYNYRGQLSISQSLVNITYTGRQLETYENIGIYYKAEFIVNWEEFYEENESLILEEFASHRVIFRFDYSGRGVFPPEIFKLSGGNVLPSHIPNFGVNINFFDASTMKQLMDNLNAGTYKEETYYDNYGNEYTSIGKAIDRYDAIELCENGFISPPLPPMSCCPNVRENDELLRLIAKRLGAYDYPVNVPKILTDRSKGTETIENLTRFHSWLGKNLDALCGKYPLEIEIKDSDLTKDGDQTKNIKIPNMAEGIGEMLGMLLQIQSETSATLNAAVRTLIEASNTKQIAIINHDYTKANAEFLGYKGEQQIRKTPFMCTPGKQRLDEVLDESEVEVKGYENVDDQDIKDLLAPLLDMAAMYRVQNFRNVGTKGTLEKLTSTLKNPQLIGLVDTWIKNDKLKRYNEKAPENQDPKELKEILENAFDKFLEEIENGFIAQAGIKDNTNPYGRPYEERPRIREIGNTTGE